MSEFLRRQADEFKAKRAEKIRMARQLRYQGFSTAETAGAMGLPESTIRTYLKEKT